MEIRTALDEELDLDPNEPLGEIHLVGGQGGSISRSNVWLDEWFLAILSGIEGLEAGETTLSVDISSDPRPLVFELRGGAIRITYKDWSTDVAALDEFRAALAESVRSVVSKLEHLEAFAENETWSTLLSRLES